MEVTITKIDYHHLKPEDIFKWLEEFGFLRIMECVEMKEMEK